MAFHAGITCDSCSKSNFPGRRYKCLLCDNYDLCGSCFDLNAESRNHQKTHGMQCILTEASAEIFYHGDSMARQFAVSLTCPYCAQSGFIPQTLLSHCVEKHSATMKANQIVICPICASSQSRRGRSRFPSLIAHLTSEHEECGDCSSMIDDAFGLVMNNNRRNPVNDSDQEADEDIEEPWTHNPELFGEFEEQIHQDEGNLRNASTAEYAWLDSADPWSDENHSSLRSSMAARHLIRQNAIKISRGMGQRGQPNSSPFRSDMRTHPSLSSHATSRHGPDRSGNRPPHNIRISNPMTNIVSQDPLLEYINQLVQYQRESASSPTNPSSNQSSRSQSQAHRPSTSNTSTTPADVARIQQQIDSRLSATRLRAAIVKQKRPSQATNQNAVPPPSATREWLSNQRPHSAVQALMDNVTSTNTPFGADIPSGSSNYPPYFLRNSQFSSQERQSLSLLTRMFTRDSDVNNDDSDEARLAHLQNHALFLRSLLLSTITSSIDEDDNQTRI